MEFGYGGPRVRPLVGFVDRFWGWIKNNAPYVLAGVLIAGGLTAATYFLTRRASPIPPTPPPIMTLTPTPTPTPVMTLTPTPTPTIEEMLLPIDRNNPIPFDQNLVVYKLLVDKSFDRTGSQPKFREGSVTLYAYRPKKADAIIKIGDREEKYSCNKGQPHFIIPKEGEGFSEVGSIGRSFPTITFNDEFVRQCAERLYRIEVPFLPFENQRENAEKRMDEFVNSLGDLERGASVIKLIPKEVKQRDYPRPYKGRSTRVIGIVAQVAYDGITILVDYDGIVGVRGEDVDVIAQPERRKERTIGPVPTPTPTPHPEKGVPY
ncbi:MAG: hypothetical protein QXD72_01925 [Candidatus Aenigmatarchaeota archaeon]